MGPAPDAAVELEALMQFLYMAPIGLVQAALDGEIAMINPMSAQLLMPLSRDGSLVNLFDALADVAPDLRHRARTYPERHGMVCDGLQMHVRRAGSAARSVPQVLSLTLLKLDDSRLMAVLSDVSVSVHRELALRRSQAWIESIVAGITDYALITLDCDGLVQCWNSSVGRVTGFDATQCVGRSYDLFYPDDSLSPQRLRDQLYESRRDGWRMDEGWRQRADGSRYWGSCLIAPLDVTEDPQPGDPAFSLIVRDISDRKEAHEALRLAVASDHLTGLANRRSFFDAAERELQHWHRMPRPLSVIMIDADHFKRVNDSHGHAAGDSVLRHLAAALGANFRPADVVARIGGEEFAVLLSGTAVADAEVIANRLCRAVAAQTLQVGDRQIAYTVSAGVAAMEAGVEDVEALMERADAALYSAKSQGRNRVECWRQPTPADAATTGAAIPRAE